MCFNAIFLVFSRDVILVTSLAVVCIGLSCSAFVFFRSLGVGLFGLSRAIVNFGLSRAVVCIDLSLGADQVGL